MESPLRFLYFDLGNVLIRFDHRRAASQVARVAGISEQKAWDAIFHDEVEWKYERGELTTREFYEAFCRQSGTQPDYEAVIHAASDIFEPNPEIMPLVERLQQAGPRLGILSNTNEAHWEFLAAGEFSGLTGRFEVHALSFRMGAIKPDAAAYETAARLADHAPHEIFFVDDRAENVAAARQAGFDAVPYTGVQALEAGLRSRGINI